MILIDSCVPMYLVGASHRHQLDAQRALEHLIGKRERLVTDAAVFEEIMHRYGVLERRDAIQPAFRALLDVVDEVLPIDRAVVEQAEIFMAVRPWMPARAGVHAAVMRVHGIAKILSFDQSFYRMPGVTWLDGRPDEGAGLGLGLGRAVVARRRRRVGPARCLVSGAYLDGRGRPVGPAGSSVADPAGDPP